MTPAGPLVAPGLPVPPGSGWPEDPATQATPVAADTPVALGVTSGGATFYSDACVTAVSSVTV